jgi:DNA-binding transcriptional regulator YiaG
VTRDNGTTSSAVGHLLRSDLRPQMAKAGLPDVRKADVEAWKTEIGRVVRRVRGAQTLKEFAAAIARDERQVARWEEGKERPQFDAIFAVRAFRGPLVLELAALAEDAQIVTTISIRRVAS